MKRFHIIAIHFRVVDDSVAQPLINRSFCPAKMIWTSFSGHSPHTVSQDAHGAVEALICWRAHAVNTIST
jgi:hypothetical protein